MAFSKTALIFPSHQKNHENNAPPTVSIFEKDSLTETLSQPIFVGGNSF